MTGGASIRWLLLQIRNPGDPILQQERDCFAQTLDCDPQHVTPVNALAGFPAQAVLDRHDAVLFGGSGDYSAAGEGDWLERILEGMRLLHARRKPTFASCWGFQALARALGGQCQHDLQHAELGAMEMSLTAAGRADPVFGQLPDRFLGMSGHEDRVTHLPADATLLASSELVAEQAFCIKNAPIYATQFHPELTRATLLQRLRAYPRYVELLSGGTFEQFEQRLPETPAANQLLKLFAETCVI